jgi:hypothetical protein
MRRLILVFVLVPVLLSLSGCSKTCAAEKVTLAMQSSDPSLLLPGNNQTIGVRITVPKDADPVHIAAEFYAPGYNSPGIPPTIATYSFPSGQLTSGGVNDTVIGWDLGNIAPGRGALFYITVTAPPALSSFGLDAKASITVTPANTGQCAPKAVYSAVLIDPTNGAE